MTDLTLCCTTTDLSSGIGGGRKRVSFPAATVPEELIRKALSEIQHDEASEIGDPVTYFVQEMHRITEQLATMKKSERAH